MDKAKATLDKITSRYGGIVTSDRIFIVAEVEGTPLGTIDIMYTVNETSGYLYATDILAVERDPDTGTMIRYLAMPYRSVIVDIDAWLDALYRSFFKVNH